MTNNEYIYELMETFIKQNKRPVRQKDLLAMGISAGNLGKTIANLKKEGKIKSREDKKGYVLLG